MYAGRAPRLQCQVPGPCQDTESGLAEEDLAMSDRIPGAEDAGDQRGSEPDMSATDEFARMRAVVRAAQKHRVGGVVPELVVADAEPGPDT